MTIARRKQWLIALFMLVMPALYVGGVYILAYATGRNWIAERNSFRITRSVYVPLRWYIHDSGLLGAESFGESIQAVYIQGKDHLIASRSTSGGKTPHP
jgi:hypothetical protein